MIKLDSYLIKGAVNAQGKRIRRREMLAIYAVVRSARSIASIFALTALESI